MSEALSHAESFAANALNTWAVVEGITAVAGVVGTICLAWTIHRAIKTVGEVFGPMGKEKKDA
jgi:hypothetical protein